MQEPIPILQLTVTSRTWESLRHIPDDMDFSDVTTNPDHIAGGRGELGFNGFSFDYNRFLNPFDEFCELWIAKCPLVRNNDIL